jgi:hypothetical protein
MSHKPGRVKTQWSPIDTQTNATATATRAALSGARHYITGYSVSVRGTTPAVGTFEVRSGANVLVRLELPAAQMAPIDVYLDFPIECNINESAVATVGAMGATQTATVSVRGYTQAE